MQLSAKPILFCISLFVKNIAHAAVAQATGRAEKIEIFGKFSTVFDPISEGTQPKKTAREPRTGVKFPPANASSTRIWTKEPTAQNTGPVSADRGPYVFNHDRGREGGKF